MKYTIFFFLATVSATYAAGVKGLRGKDANRPVPKRALKGGGDDENVLTVKDDGMFDSDGTYQTIQAAVDAASPGDTIKILAHSQPSGYQEYVSISTPNIKLIGEGASDSLHAEYVLHKNEDTSKSLLESFQDMSVDHGFLMPFSDKLLQEQKCPTVVVDGSKNWPNTRKFTSILIDAADVVIENVYLRHGQVEITDHGHRAVIQNNCILGDVPQPIRTIYLDHGGTGVDNVLIQGNFFQGGRDESISITHGSNHVIRENLLTMADSGIKVTDNYMTGISNVEIADNVIMGCNDDCITYLAANGVIMNNVIMSGQYGIRYRGDKPTIINNKVLFMSSGSRGSILVTCAAVCTGGEVSRNLVYGSQDSSDGIELEKVSSFKVLENEVYFTAFSGLIVSGHDTLIKKNVFSRCGTEYYLSAPSMKIEGDANLIEENQILFLIFVGIEQKSGKNNQYRKNYIMGVGHDGIRIKMSSDGTIVHDNVFESIHGNGIHIETDKALTLTKNEMKNNRIDWCVNKYIMESFTPDNVSHDFDTNRISGGLDHLCDL